jgi:hypothetical protein
MWRKWTLVIFWAATAVYCQPLPTPETSQLPAISGNTQTTKINSPEALVSLSYNQLRRGHEEEIAIAPMPMPGECFAHSYDSARWDFDPGSLRLELAPGFTIHYGDGKDFKSYSTAFFTRTEAGNAILLKLKAANDMPLGTYKIVGKINFTSALKENCSMQQDVIIPVTVVDHNAHAVKESWSYQQYSDHNFRETLDTILLIPLLPFIAIIFVIQSAINCGDLTCHDY